MAFFSRNNPSMSKNMIKASEEGREADVKRLLESGVNVNAVENWSGQTALHKAIDSGHTVVANILLKNGANVNAIDKNGQTALHLASSWEYKDIVQEHEAPVQLLLDNGANINAGDKFGWRALHLASTNGHTDIVNLLLQKGADINAECEIGSTALHLASLNGHTDTVELLLLEGADIKAVNKYHFTALHRASQNGYVNTVSRLLETGADVNAVDKNGDTALDIARLRGHQDIVKILMAYMDKVKVQSQHSSKPVAIVGPSLERGDDIGVLTQKKVIEQQTAGATSVVAAGATAGVAAGMTAGATAKLKEDKLEETKVSNKHRVEPPVERDDDIGVLTQEMAQLNRGQIPEADLKTLRYFHLRMKRDLRPFPLIDHLFEKDVIDENQLEIITIRGEQLGRAASIAKMLEILWRCGNHAFQLFLECLEQEDVGYAELASELRKHRYGGAQP